MSVCLNKDYESASILPDSNGCDIYVPSTMSAATASLNSVVSMLDRSRTCLGRLDGNISLVICLETLEHINPAEVDIYLKNIRRAMSDVGYFIVTIPNEKGTIFLIKYILKRLYYGETWQFSVSEFVATVAGHLGSVERDNHKGFDWQTLVTQLENHFEIIKIEGVQVAWLPPSLNVNIGIVCTPTK